MTPFDPDLPVVLVACADEAVAATLHEVLPPHVPLTANDGASARRMLADRRVALVLADFRLPDESGLELLGACAKTYPTVVRLLLAELADLPEIVRARATGLVRRVIPRTARPRRARQVVAEELGAAHEATVTKTVPGLAGHERRTHDLLRWTVERITRVPGVVIRELPTDPTLLQVQLVLPNGEWVDTLRSELVLGWERVKERGAAPTRAQRQHPLLRRLPDLSRDAEVLASDVGDGAFVYVALLPWRREPRTTAVIGVVSRRFEAPWWALLQDVHRIALEEVAEFPLPYIPSDEEATGTGHHVLEYDWVVTKGYVGPDRRVRPTSFLNRFMFFGRRRRVPSRVRQVTDVFVDRLGAPVFKWAAAYLALSAVDTALTFHFVRSGTVHELNPVLLPLVVEQPALFFVVKNALALLGLFLVARFHLFRAGYWILGFTLTGYVLLDGYWVWLLLTRR